MGVAGEFAGPLAFGFVVWVLGFGAALLAGVRDYRLAVALGVPVTVVAVMGSTLVHVVLPLRFGWATPIAVLVLGAGVVRLAFRGRALGSRWQDGPGPHRGSAPGGRSHRHAGAALRLALVLGVCLSGAYLAVFLACGQSWETVSQTWDALFDANATRAVYQTGVVDPLRISDFAYPTPIHTYYPSTFHALGSLQMTLTGSDAVVATNVVAGLLAGCLWPSVAVLAAWVVLGPDNPRPEMVALLSGGFWSMPWAPLGWGVLWASALSAAFVPLVAAGVVVVMTGSPVLGRRGAGVLAVAGLLAVAALHPRIGIIAGLLVFGTGICWAVPRVLTLARARAWGWAITLAGAVLVSSGVLFVFFRRFGRGSSQFDGRLWPVERPAALEVLGYLVNGPGGSVPQLVTAVAVAIGLAVAWRKPALRPLAVFATGAVVLDILTATVRQVWVFDIVARFWYNDRVRTSAVAAGGLVVVAAVGWRAMTGWWTERQRARSIRSWRGAAAYPAAAAALAFVLGTGFAVPYLSLRYVDSANDPSLSVVTQEEIEAFRRVAEIVPEGDRILNNANDGSALLYAYVNRKPTLLIAGLAGSTPNSEYLRDQLILLEPSNICKRMQDDGIRWVINNGRAFANGVIDEATSPRLQIPPGFPLMTERMRIGHTVLFELTGCRA